MSMPLARDARAAPAVDRLKVLEFCDYYGVGSKGGTERVAREVSRRLAGTGIDLAVVTALDGPAFADDGVPVHARPARDLSPLTGAQLSLARGYHRWALRLARTLAPDVIYAHSLHFQGSLVAARVSRRLRIPLVTVVHVADLRSLSGRSRVLGEAWERTLGRFILSSSRRVVAVSEATADHCRALGAAVPMTVVPNGVDHDRFVPAPPFAGLPTVTFVGRLIENKGPALLLAAADRLWAQGHRFRVVFVGDGPLRAPLERVAASSRGEVRFVGHRNDVHAWLRRSHVVARPSFTEGMPLTVLETMASARCAVVSDIAPHRELVDHLYDGILHRVGDVNDLADKLALVLADPELRDRVASSAAWTAREYTWDRTATGHHDALRSAVSERVASRAG